MKNNKGMTLVELLVTFSLLLVIVVGLYNLILEVKFEIDNKQIVKDSIEYSSLMNNDIHYNLLVDKPFAIAYRNSADDSWTCYPNTAVSSGSGCKVTDKIVVDYNYGGVSRQTTTSFENLDVSICKKVYPCAVYYHYIKSNNTIAAKVIALSKYSADENITGLKDGLKVKGVLYGNINDPLFEPIPNNDFIEIRDIRVNVADEAGNFTTVEANKPEIKVSDGILTINYGFYIIDDDRNYGFKIAYPFS